MKRSLKAWHAVPVIALGCGVIISGCRSDQTSPSDPLAQKVVALGFRGEMIEDMGDYFLVEGDIRISKLFLRQQTDGPRPQLQWVTDLLVGSSQVQNVLVDLSGLSSQPDWQNAARSALTEWNKVNCSSVRLTEGSPADIAFSTFTDFARPGLAARADFPLDAPEGSGKPGPTIGVNTAYTGTPNTASTKLRNMVHEIGHTIGFRHTNWQALNEDQNPDHEKYGANQVSGTPPTDAASVMNGQTATASWVGFSRYDTVAARVTYPGGPCVTPIQGHDRIIAGQICHYTESPTGGTPPYTKTWSYVILSGSVAAFPSGDGFTLVGQSTYGQARLRVDVSDATGPIGSAVDTVTIDPLGVNCP
jgi:hypothetical protein